MSIYPKSKVTVSAMTVTTEITEEDEGDPRIIEVSLHDDESPGLIKVTNKSREDSWIAFFVEQWPSIRSAVDQLAGCARTHDEVMGVAPKQEPAAWQGVHDKTDLYFRRPTQGDARPLCIKEDESGLVMALSQASAMIERLQRERSQVRHGLSGLLDYLRVEPKKEHREHAKVALRHAFNCIGAIVAEMHKSDSRTECKE